MEIWKGDILIADLEDLENVGCISYLPQRTKAREVLISQRDDEFVFPIADGTAKFSKKKKTTNSEYPPQGGNNL